MEQNSEVHYIEKLEQLILDDGNFSKLESELAKLNIFDAINMGNQEIRHSSLLAFLLNPSETHNLDDLFLKHFLIHALGRQNSTEGSLFPLQIDISNFKDAEVETEHNTGNGRIDIFVVSQSRKLVAVIENKIFSGETGNQLIRYENYINSKPDYAAYQKLFIFLTPEGDLPEDEAMQERYILMDYSQVTDTIDTVMAKTESIISIELKVLLQHYVEMLKRNNIIESDMTALYRTMWNGTYHRLLNILADSNLLKSYPQLAILYHDLQNSRHQLALELLIKNKPDLRSELADYVEHLVRNESSVSLIITKRKRLNVEFRPEHWTSPLLAVTPKEAQQNPPQILLRYGTINIDGWLSVSIGVSVGAQETRALLFNALRNDKRDTFNKLQSKLNTKYNMILNYELYQYDQQILTPEIKQHIKANWQNFIAGPFQEFNVVVEEVMTNSEEWKQLEKEYLGETV